MSLYQKYRPKDFESLVGQEFVKIALKNALIKDKTVGAYLFYGSRGTGKTTVARILAKAVNCTSLKEDGNPCLDCENCKAFENDEMIDVIEIDAASNTGVDNIRDLIEKSQFQPNNGKFKVYIIDEVHMLSKGAFNALLKTLEEPPNHVKFILATTEIHKIPETIISRTQRYDFKRISENDIVSRLKEIAHNENISTEEEAIKLIARLSKGGLRDAIAFFEQYSIGGSLKLDYLRSNLQLVGDEFLENFSINILNKNKDEVINNLDFLQGKGIDIRIFLEEFSFFLHTKAIAFIDDENLFVGYMSLYDLVIDIYSKLKKVPNTFLLLEYSILKNILGYNKSIDSIIFPQKDLKKETKTIKKEELKNSKEELKKSDNTEEEVKEKTAQEESKIDFSISDLIDSIKQDNGKGFVVMTLKSSEIIFGNGELCITASNQFNFEKLNSPETKVYISKKINELFGIDTKINVEKK